MRRDQRLTRTGDFATARREGRSWSDSRLVLVARPNGLDVTRFGFSVGKRIGASVVRNRVKRRLREAARLTRIRQGWDLVLIARKEASASDFHGLERSMASLFGRAGVVDSSIQLTYPSGKAD